MPVPRGPLPSTWIVVVLAAVAAVGHDGRRAAAAPPAAEAGRVDLVRDMPDAADLAAPSNGQTLYVLDSATGGVVAVDPFEPGRRWTAVDAPQQPDGDPRTVSIGCIDTTTLALLGRGREGWTLRTYRVQPGVSVEFAKPLQTLGVAAGKERAGAAGGPAAGDERACLVVSPSREWLLVCGLPAPLPAVARAPIAGARIGSVSAKGCPVFGAESRPDAAAISPGEEVVLFARGPGEARAGGLSVAFHLPSDPRRLLSLETGLSSIADAAFCRADGTLWVVGVGSDGGERAEGLWRIDAVFHGGRQAARASCIARLEEARSLVCLSERVIIVTHGRSPRSVSRIDPGQQGSRP